MWEFATNISSGGHTIQLQVANCTPVSADTQFPSGLFSLEARRQGAIVVHILVTIYIFFSLAIVSDHYFVPAIEKLAKDLRIPSSVAGASLMAAAASIPNLATNIVGSVITHDDIGIGAVVGSSFFNVLFIPGAFGLAVVKQVELTPWPVIRDSVAYIVSSVVLALVIWDREVHWYESLSLLLLYIVYLIFLMFSDKCKSLFENCSPCFKCCKRKDSEKVGLVSSAIKSYGLAREGNMGEDKIIGLGGEIKVRNPSIEDIRKIDEEENKEPVKEEGQAATFHDVSAQTEKQAIKDTSEEYIDDGKYRSIMSFPKGKFERLAWIIMLPATLVIFLLIPDFKRPGCCRNVHFLTLTMSVVFIGGISYVLVWMISLIGETFGIPSSIMGMTLLAAGGSLPDCLNSVFAARKGYVDMAFSNAIGSNMFDILFCLSVPWLIDYLFIEVREPVPIYANMTLVAIFLLTSGVIVLTATAATGFKINKKMAVFFIITYVCFIILDCAIELETELPPCT